MSKAITPIIIIITLLTKSLLLKFKNLLAETSAVSFYCKYLNIVMFNGAAVALIGVLVKFIGVKSERFF